MKFTDFSTDWSDATLNLGRHFNIRYQNNVLLSTVCELWGKIEELVPGHDLGDEDIGVASIYNQVAVQMANIHALGRNQMPYELDSFNGNDEYTWHWNIRNVRDHLASSVFKDQRARAELKIDLECYIL